LKDRSKEKLKGLEEEEGDVSNYWMNFRKREDAGSGKRKQYIVLVRELAFEKATDLSSGRLHDFEHVK
jgi:hypothetical protein